MAQIKKRLLSYRLSILVTMGWGTAFAALTLWMIFQGLLLPLFKPLPTDIANIAPTLTDAYYLGLFGLSIVSGVLIADFTKVIGGVIGSYFLGSFIVLEVLAAPNLTDAALNNLHILITRDTLTTIAIDLTFRALFPFPLIVIFMGGVFGTILEERYLS